VFLTGYCAISMFVYSFIAYGSSKNWIKQMTMPSDFPIVSNDNQ